MVNGNSFQRNVETDQRLKSLDVELFSISFKTWGYGKNHTLNLEEDDGQRS